MIKRKAIQTERKRGKERERELERERETKREKMREKKRNTEIERGLDGIRFILHHSGSTR